jgi:site-specific DNA recombinase
MYDRFGASAPETGKTGEGAKRNVSRWPEPDRPLAGNKSGPSPNPALICALRQAHALLGRDDAGAPTIITVPNSTYQRRLICLAFLAPDIQEAILTGRQPVGLTLNDLMDRNLPLLWSDQCKTLGFPPVG